MQNTFFFVSVRQGDELVPTGAYANAQTVSERIEQEWKLRSTPEALEEQSAKDQAGGWDKTIEFKDIIVEELPVINVDGKPSWIDSLPDTVDKEYVHYFGEEYYTSHELRSWIEGIYQDLMSNPDTHSCQVATPEIMYEIQLHQNGGGDYDDYGSDDDITGGF